MRRTPCRRSTFPCVAISDASRVPVSPTTLGSLDRLLITRFANRLERLAAGRLSAFQETRAWSLHAVPHSLDFAAVHRVSQRLRLPMFLSLHDDPGYALRGRPERAYALRCLSAAWRESRDRFVISEEMGIEMCRRYGEQSYTIVTDGLERVASAPRPVGQGQIIGLLHGCGAHFLREQLQLPIPGACTTPG